LLTERLTNLYKFNYSTFGNFVNDKVSFSVIYFNIYFEIADYFHVSVDYLLGREDIEKIKEPVDLKDIVSDHVNFEDVNWDEWLSFGGKPLTEKDKMLLFATFYNRDEK